MFDAPGDCPHGDTCPIHFRVDEVMDDLEVYGYFHAVTYVGEYAVFTRVGALSPTPQTSVFKVGEGTLYDMVASGEFLSARIFNEQHEDERNLLNEHEFMVNVAGGGFFD